MEIFIQQGRMNLRRIFENLIILQDKVLDILTSPACSNMYTPFIIQNVHMVAKVFVRASL